MTVNVSVTANNPVKAGSSAKRGMSERIGKKMDSDRFIILTK